MLHYRGFMTPVSRCMVGHLHFRIHMHAYTSKSSWFHLIQQSCAN
uniref:Uncharacterized protein n=1 Tax=Arundo donax TaxID=35708 RepID=A0A0A9BTZ2_ARUDO